LFSRYNWFCLHNWLYSKLEAGAFDFKIDFDAQIYCLLTKHDFDFQLTFSICVVSSLEGQKWLCWLKNWFLSCLGDLKKNWFLSWYLLIQCTCIWYNIILLVHVRQIRFILYKLLHEIYLPYFLPQLSL